MIYNLEDCAQFSPRSTLNFRILSHNNFNFECEFEYEITTIWKIMFGLPLEMK